MARVLRSLSALVVAGVVTTAGCTGGSTDTSTTSTSGGKAASGGGGKTLTYLIGQPEDPQDLVEIKKDITKFESQNKGTSVKLNVLPNDNLRTVLQTQLQSGSGPDVFGYDTGPGFAGVLAKAGLLYDLGPAYTKYNWKIYPWAKERVTFGGKTVGVPNQVEEVGVYYNKSLFAKYGISQPKNLGELQAAAEKFKSNGVTPMTFADKEGWEGGHLLSAPLSSAVGSKGMQALLAGKTPWTSAPVVDSINLFFSDFNKKGYLPKSPNALTYDNGNALFYSGKAAMNPTGTWQAKVIGQTVKFPVGFMPFPAKNGPGIFVSGLGSGTFVSAKTKNPDGALKFLDYLTTPEHGRWQVETFNNIPAYPVDTKGLKTSPLFAQILADTSKIASGAGDFGYNIDVLSTDKFNKAMWDGLQGVLFYRLVFFLPYVLPPISIGMLLAAPTVLITAVFFVFPLCSAIYFGMTSWNGATAAAPFVGLANFTELLGDREVWHALGNNAIWIVLGTVAPIVIGLILSVLLWSGVQGVLFYRLVFFLPYVLPPISIGIVWIWIYDPINGWLNRLLTDVGLGRFARGWLGEPRSALYAVLLAAIWSTFGFVVVIFLAALQNVDLDLVDAARIDGANSAQRLWHVILPQITPVFLMVTTVILVGGFSVFDIIFIMTNGGPGNATNVLGVYSFQNAFQLNRVGYGTALALVISLLSLPFVILLNRVQRQMITSRLGITR